MKLDLKSFIKENPLLLAPMDAVTDIGFRELCEDQGASYTCTELISVESLIRGKVPIYRYQRRNLKINCVQIFGSNPESFEEATKFLVKTGEADIIDINFGCPSSSVTGADSGSILLKDPEHVEKIVKAVVKHSNVPVTAKIRLGYTSKTYLEIAKIIENAGVSLITVHGRTAKQKYSGTANWDAIKEVYDNLSIPVIGNGDIKEEADIKKIGIYCDALMIGRAAIGNPYLFKRLSTYYKTKKIIEIDDRKQIQKDMFVKYLNKIEDVDFYKKEFKIKQQSMWFMKGVEGSKELRKNIQDIKDSKTIIEMIKKF